ncbi:MAG: metalloregulator ArsR/SmtB family transcription factor [Rhodobacteraceae bacterium]|nr:metalloregulator ArsR/SmtB family transcription factor [Paracoccaceae bacterium]
MKAEHTLEEYEALAARCKALAHPARLVILQILAERGTCVCGEVVEILPLSQATVSQHLKVLLQAGLITGRVDGQNSCYCLNTSEIARLRLSADALFGNLETCC